MLVVSLALILLVPVSQSTPIPLLGPQILDASHQTYDGRYGHDVDTDGIHAVIGAYDSDHSGSRSGAAFVWTRGLAGWQETHVLASPNPESGGRFAASVALEDGLIAAGAAHEARAYVFALSGGEWTLDGTFDVPGAQRLGIGIDVSDGRVVVGDDLARAAHVFEKIDGSWTLTQTLQPPTTAAQFGYDVAIDGDLIVVGAPGANQAHIYQEGPGGWTLLTTLEPNTDAGRFGHAVDVRKADGLLAGNEATIFVGAPWTDDQTGRAFLYHGTAGSWSETSVVDGPHPKTGGQFGVRGAIGPASVIISEPAPAHVTDETGVVHVYGDASSQWMFERSMTPDEDVRGFGSGIAISSTALIIGAEMTSLDEQKTGIAYAHAQFAWPGA